VGPTGDLDKAIELPKFYDRKVDVFGVGGLEFYLQVGNTATLLAFMDKPQSVVTPTDFQDLIECNPLKPNVEILN
jgi:hypothetical protein